VYEFEPDQILAGNGSDDLLAMIIRACVGPNDRVVYRSPRTVCTTPWWPSRAGSRCTSRSGGVRLASGLAEARGRVTFLCNPNSPSATYFSPPQVDELSRSVAGLLVVDEAYVDFAPSRREAGARASERRRAADVFEVLLFGGSADRTCLGSSEVIRELAKVKDSYNLTRVSIAAAVAGARGLRMDADQRPPVCDTRERLVRGLRDLSFDVLPSAANFVLARRRVVTRRRRTKS